MLLHLSRQHGQPCALWMLPMTQLAFETVPKRPCALTTYAAFVDGGGYVYQARCACGWTGPDVATGPKAAKTWMDHDAVLRKSEGGRE